LGFAELTGYGKTVFAREHYVEDQGFEVMFFLEEGQSFFAFAGDLDRMAFGFEIKTKTFGEMGFVFDNEDTAHAR
jgi:hypothetical protein